MQTSIPIVKYDDDSDRALKIVDSLVENEEYNILKNILDEIIDNECFNQGKDNIGIICDYEYVVDMGVYDD